jgi:hypothetical protein
MKHRLKTQRTIWHQLRDAGIALIVGMLGVLVALAIGLAAGLRLFP